MFRKLIFIRSILYARLYLQIGRVLYTSSISNFFKEMALLLYNYKRSAVIAPTFILAILHIKSMSVSIRDLLQLQTFIS